MCILFEFNSWLAKGHYFSSHQLNIAIPRQIINSGLFSSLTESYEDHPVHLQIENDDLSDKSGVSDGVFAVVKPFDKNAKKLPEDNSDKSSSELEITVEVKTSDEPTYSTQSTLEAKEKNVVETPKIEVTVISPVLEAEEPEAPPADENSVTSDSEIFVDGPKILK